MDWATDLEAASRYQRHLCGHGYVWHNDWTWHIFQRRKTICFQARVSSLHDPSNRPQLNSHSVCTAAGDRVPGPRSYALLAPVEFPWRKAVDQIEEVGSADSYSLSLELIRNGLVCGPSSGFNLQGLYQMLGKRKSEGTLNDIKGPDGQIHCVFLCCDLPYQYVSEYFDKLGAEHFPAMKNEVCIILCNCFLARETMLIIFEGVA